MKVLIVEDTPYKRQTVESILRKYRLKYDTAEYGIDAFKLVEKYQYQLIILDLGFSIREGGKYDPKQGLILLENIQIFCRRKKRKLPKVIVYSETYLRPTELEENSLEQAENSVQLKELISKYLNDKDVQ